MNAGFAEKLAEHFIARQNILERYIDVCPIPCFIVNKEGETIFINEAYQQAFNVRLDQVDRRQWEKIVAPVDRERYINEFDHLIQVKQSFHYTTAHLLVNDKPVFSIIRITHVPGNGYIGYIIFQCSHTEECPVRSLIDEYLARTN